MKVPFALAALYPIFLSASATTVLDVEPIYIGHVFYPPSMYFLAWTPSGPSVSKEVAESPKSTTPEWCRTAIDVSNAANFSIAHPQFTRGNLTNLRLHDYFSEDAYIERNGKRWGECYITPESGDIGDVPMEIDGLDGENGRGVVEIGTMMSLSVGSGYTGAMEQPAWAQETGRPKGSEVKEAFTAVMTGSNY
ncbi:hypothetical protein H4I96_12007 [Botrytis cinerea]